MPFGSGGVVAPATALVSDAQVPALQTQAEQPEVDNTITRIQVHNNGTGIWTVQIRTRLQNQSEIDAYRTFQDRFRAERAQYRDQFRDRMMNVVDNAANATGREMYATEFTASTSIQEMPRRWGVITYRFAWHGFAQQNGDEVVVGDVFQGGFYLAADDILVIEPASSVQSITSVEPIPDSRSNESVTWIGATDFSDGYPRVRIATGSGTSPPGDGSGGASVPVGPMVGVLALVVVAAGAYFVTTSRQRSTDDDDSADMETEDGDTGDNGYDTEILTDEELVLAYLDDHGRVPQSDIGDEFGWSSSKTSRVLSEMAENGQINKLRLGRQNVIEPVDDDNDTDDKYPI